MLPMPFVEDETLLVQFLGALQEMQVVLDRFPEAWRPHVHEAILKGMESRDNIGTVAAVRQLLDRARDAQGPMFVEAGTVLTQ